MLKVGYFLRKQQNSLQNYKYFECEISRILLKQSFISAFSICMTVPLNEFPEQLQKFKSNFSTTIYAYTKLVWTILFTLLIL